MKKRWKGEGKVDMSKMRITEIGAEDRENWKQLVGETKYQLGVILSVRSRISQDQISRGRLAFRCTLAYHKRLAVSLFKYFTNTVSFVEL